MKFDSRGMEEAYLQMRNLQQQIEQVQDQVREILTALSRQHFGEQASKAIENMLVPRVGSLERRAQSAQLLADCLRQIRDDYMECERTAKDNAGQDFSAGSGTGEWKPPQWEPIPIGVEQGITDQYIMPLIAKGRKGIT